MECHKKTSKCDSTFKSSINEKTGYDLYDINDNDFIKLVNRSNQLIEGGRANEVEKLFFGVVEFNNSTKLEQLAIAQMIKASNIEGKRVKEMYYTHLLNQICPCKDKVDLHLLYESNLKSPNINGNRYYNMTIDYLAKCDIVKAIFFYALYVNESETSHYDDEIMEILSGHFNFDEVFALFCNKRIDKKIVFLLDSLEFCSEYIDMALAINDKADEILIITSGKDRKEIMNKISMKNSNCTLEIRVNESDNPLGYIKTLVGENSFYVFAERTSLDSVENNTFERKYIHYLTNPIEYLNQVRYTAFAFCGDYLDFISELYSINAKEELYKKSIYDFSIVIPVRDNVETLRYTLKTCLEIEYDNYEIVISDNSETDIVKDYILNLNSNKINYYRTPIALQLGRSFEYAYLMSKGDFLIPIGADEGILKSSLSNLKGVLESHPTENVFAWGTLSYNWPQTGVVGQEDKIVIGKMFSKHNIGQCKVVDSKEKLNRVISLEDPMLTMPTLYQRSGMKRRFLQQIYNVSNTIVDGFTQDIFMGTLVLTITDHYLDVDLPVVVIGNSNYSSGADSQRALECSEKTQKGIDKFRAFNRGNFAKRGSHIDIPLIYYSWGMHFFMCILNLLDRGLIDVTEFNNFNWTNIFKYSIKEIKLEYDFHNDTIFKILKVAQRYVSSEDFAEMLEIVKNKKSCYEAPIGKSFEEGIRKDGSLSIDGAKFQVTNIYEATKFIENILNV